MSDAAPVPADEQLSQAARVLARLTRFVEQACQNSELSLPQYRLLLFIARSPQRAGELASRAAVSRPTLTSLMDGLEKQGMVTRGAVAGDRRGISLELTEKGTKALADTEARVKEELASLASASGAATFCDDLLKIGVELDRRLDEIAARRREAEAQAAPNGGASS